ncbi:unnamed protein product [Cladocopium goreaui]|uniref:Rhodanese domain-containing protein n=1 Tax=Cladocopium goreaui TaxID=2562237 RepID=A0A9P1BIT5_9DINO|nr:unnamed protein product [Cladocopium goreaui]
MSWWSSSCSWSESPWRGQDWDDGYSRQQWGEGSGSWQSWWSYSGWASGSAGSAGKGKGKEESQPKRLRHEQAPTIGFDIEKEDEEYVYAYVPWVMSDYKNQCLRPVIAEIEEMGCFFKMKVRVAQKCSRVSIRGKEARNAWKHFLDSTRKLLPEKLPEFPKMSHVLVKDDDVKDEGGTEVKDEPDWDADDDKDEDEDLPAASGQAAPVTPPRRSPKTFTGKSTWQKKRDGCDDALEAETEPNLSVSTDKTGCLLVTDQAGRIITRLMPEAQNESMGQEMEGSKMYRLAQKIAKEAIEKCGLSSGPELMLKSHVSMLKNSSREDLSTMLTFCTCCFGRGWQLRISLPINLAIMEKYEMTTRFCISLFRPTEDQLYNVSVGLTTFPLSKELVQEVERDFQETKKWILENCQEELRSGKLVCSVHRREFFHSSVCKNTCHKLALLEALRRGRESEGDEISEDLAPPPIARFDALWALKQRIPPSYTLRDEFKDKKHILCNLDADNILSADFAAQIDSHFGKTTGPGGLTPGSGNYGNAPVFGGRCSGGDDLGCCGRVLINDRGFLELQGYDESFHPTGFQDIDLWTRTKTKARQAPKMKFFAGWSVPNCSDNAFKAVAIEKNRLTGCNLRWGQQDTENRADAARKLAEGKWWRNSIGAPISCRDMWELMLSLGNADPEGKTLLLTARKLEQDDGLTSTALKPPPLPPKAAPSEAASGSQQPMPPRPARLAPASKYGKKKGNRVQASSLLCEGDRMWSRQPRQGTQKCLSRQKLAKSGLASNLGLETSVRPIRSRGRGVPQNVPGPRGWPNDGQPRAEQSQHHLL